ncbi:efflux RND transporter periplasmic adaptor subunit [bacterium]|nr:efflux RND transporter periplasmic adaptor subunit [bacterium]
MKTNKENVNAWSSNRVLAVLVCLIVILPLLFSACQKEAETVTEEVVRPVKTITVSSAAGASGITLPGKVRASRRVELAFKDIGGRLIELPIEGKEGQMVKKDELLARIDPKDYEVSLENAKGKLKEAEAALKLAQTEYARVQRIRKQDPGAVSQASVDRRREAANQAKGRIRSLKATVDDAKNQLSYTYLRAPFTGVIAKRFVNNFQDVKPKQPILSLEEISQVEILVDVPENLMAGVSGEEKGTISLVAEFPTAPEKKYPLTLKEYATKADPATQTYQVVFQMPQPEGVNVLPGMTATVTADLGEAGQTGTLFIIPAIAVLADPDGKSYVWVVESKDMTVHKRKVDVGRLTGSENIDILGGLNEGEKIVVAGALKLQEGMKVRFWDQQ